MLLAGVVFISSSLYIGYAHPMSYFYTGVGVTCFFWSAIVYAMRQHYRNREQADEHEEVTQL